MAQTSIIYHSLTNSLHMKNYDVDQNIARRALLWNIARRFKHE